MKTQKANALYERVVPRDFAVASAMVLALGAFGGGLALAEDVGPPRDSSADAASGFDSLMNESSGVLVRVPVNDRGEENTDVAELRAYTGDVGPVEAGDLKTAWERGVDIGAHPAVAGAITDTPTDSSTSRYNNRYNWNRWSNRGWSAPGYYSHYRPYYQPYYRHNAYNPYGYYYGAPIVRPYYNGYFGGSLGYYPRYNTYWYPRISYPY